MKGIIYTRVSSDEQVKGTSLERQEELCRNFCKERGIEVMEIFREEGASAKTADRAVFLRAIEFCRKNKGKVNVFVVYKVDRFARNTEDHFYVRKMLIDSGVTLNSVTEPIGNNPAEKFIETVLAGSAEFDNAVRRQRAIDGMIARINQGIRPWRVPPGYTCQYTRRRGIKKNEPDQPDTEVFPIIQAALREFSKGHCTQKEMIALLDKLGLSKVRGKKTSAQLISKILRDYLPFYAGIVFNPWANEEVKGMHQPMITKEEYYRIKLILSGKKLKMKHTRYNPDFPLRGTVLCASCGKQLTGSCSKGNGGKYNYYHCYNKQCEKFGKGIKKFDLEAEFIVFLDIITPKKEFVDLFKATVVDMWKEKDSTIVTDVRQYEKQLAVLQEKRKRIFEMREDGLSTNEEFKERKEEIDNQIMATKISLSESRIELFDVESVLNYALKNISDLGKQWFDIGESRARFQKMLFPDGIHYSKEKGFGTTRLGLIYEINRAFLPDDSLLVRQVIIHWNQIVEELREWANIKAYFETRLV